MNRFFLFLVPCALSTAQTFSNISTSNDLDHESARIVMNVSGATSYYAQILCGVATGGPYNSVLSPSYQIGNHSDAGEIVVDFGGLTPSTEYYCVPTVKPNPNNSSGLVTGGEFNFTTLPSPVHPVIPTPPASYNPTAPGNFPNLTAGYTIVRMIAGANSTAECKAAANVGPVAYGLGASWSVTAGDTVQTVLNEVGYGAILEFDEGITCPVPAGAGGSAYNSGYVQPVKSIDPQATGGSIDAANHRFIVIRTNQTNLFHFPAIGFRTGPQWDTYLATFQAQTPMILGAVAGQHFLADNSNTGPVHHYFTYNLHFTVNSALSSGPWHEFIGVGSNGSGLSSANPPQYMVYDRDHFDCPGLPTVCQDIVFGIPAGNFAFTNNYASMFDGNSSTGFAQGLYLTDCTGKSGGPITIDNNLITAVGQGIYFEANNGYTCGGTSAISPVDITITHNTLYWPLSTLDSSYASNPLWDGVTRQPNRNQMEFKRGRRILIQGNLIDGQWSGQNEGSAIFASGNNDNQFTGQTGVFDVNATFNIIRHSANVFYCMATRPMGNPGPPDNAINRRMLFANNLSYALGRYNNAMNGSAGGLYSDYFVTEPGCQDVTIQNNTYGFTNADSGSSGLQFDPGLMVTGGGGALSEGFFFRNNIAYFSIGNPTSTNGGVNADLSQTGCCAGYQAYPLPNASSFYSAFQTSFIQAAASVIPNGIWGRNILIGGTLGNTGTEPWPDLTQGQLNFYNSVMPGVAPNLTALVTPDTYPSGPTKGAREAAAGLLNVANSDYTCTPTTQNPCAGAANLRGLEAALGIVSNIVVRAGPSALLFSYTAPDSRTCSVDTSPDGVNWTRTADIGGSEIRSLVVSGLAANTSYGYRLNCYFSQTAPWFSFPSDPSNLITDGVAMQTVQAGTRALQISLPFPPGAIAAQLTATAVGGAPISQTCSVSPCTIPGVQNGAVLIQISYLNVAGTTISSGSIWVQ